MGEGRLRGRARRLAQSLDEALLPFMGPAQIGAGRPEEPYVRPTDARCPVCGAPMAEHEIRRSAGSTVPTKLICPDRERRTP